MTMRKDLEKIKIYINEKMVEQVEILKYLRIGIHEKVKRKQKQTDEMKVR